MKPPPPRSAARPLSQRRSQNLLRQPPRWIRPTLIGLLALIALALPLTWWGNDSHQRTFQNRTLGVIVQEQLRRWFPQSPTPVNDGWYGLEQRVRAVNSRQPRIVLVHGMDEPGNIWHDLFPVLDAAGFEVWEFRYPQDQSLDAITQDFAQRWATLPTTRPVIVIGHDLGGLVLREFITRWRHPVGSPPRSTGAVVRGAVLIATPNQGTDWARLRVWLELRDQFLYDTERRFALFAALRDGTAAAVLDVQPGSATLTALNAQAWPETVGLQLIGGVLTAPTPQMTASIAALVKATAVVEFQEALMAWWTELGAKLGDGVLPLEALALPNAPAPLALPASHRGLLTRAVSTDPEPVAIAPLVQMLQAWSGEIAVPRSVNPAPALPAAPRR
ncbi:esterase/lipase family protein [Chromatium okenii]|uniref:esterase/lipase family protein n=1 Tax=Chromatium okenii TaxID=61644 RepID=UPI0019090439|nr:alpha/beta hydrolase [Chromatium okenii]